MKFCVILKVMQPVYAHVYVEAENASVAGLDWSEPEGRLNAPPRRLP